MTKGAVKCPKCGESDQVQQSGPSHFSCWTCKTVKKMDGEDRTMPFNFRTPQENKERKER